MNCKLIHHLFEQSAVENPDRIAVRDGQGKITYRELNEAADRLCARLQNHPNWTAGSLAALCLPAGIAYVKAMLAVMKAGGVFVPMDISEPTRRFRMLLDKVRPAIGLTGEGSPSDIQTIMGDIPLDDVAAESVECPRKSTSIAGDDPCYIVFTSGSSGEPKAIVGTHKGISHFVQWEVREFGIDPAARISQLAPPTFDVSLRDILTPLAAGGAVCIPSAGTRGRIDRLVDFLRAEQITLMHCVPSLFRAMISELERRPRPEAALPHLRQILLAGEPLYGGDIQRWRAIFGESMELVNLYGPSETTLAKAFYRIRGLPREAGRMIPVGHPLPDTEMLIVRDGEQCDPGEIGEVYIKTPFMTRGYYRDPERTAEVFVQNPLALHPDIIYRTGDLGRYGNDGTVELLGRQDSQVKVNGVRVELAEIEGRLMEHPSVQQAAIVAHTTPDRETYLAAYYLSSSALTGAELRDHLSSTLPASMHPAFFLRMDQLPLNPHGKVLRRALPRPAELLYWSQPCVAPLGEVEEALAAIWNDLLQIGQISATHSFVELGGGSLKAIQVLAAIAQRFGVEIKLNELYPHGTIRQLASLISERSGQPQSEMTSAAVS